MPTLDDLMPYDAPRRDLASQELWQRSLRRSRHRRDLAVISRRERTRRKGVSAVVSAAMVTAPAAPTLAAAAGGSGSRAAAAQTSGGDVPVVLRAGSTGPGVEALQRALGITDDGIFGPQTEAALRAFQARNGLAVTGVVDAATWSQLFGTSVSVVDESSPLAQEVMASAGASGSTATSSVATTTGAGIPAGDGPAPSSGTTNRAPQVQGDAAPAPRNSGSGDGSSGSAPAPAPRNQTDPSPTDSTPAPAPNPGSGGSCGSGEIRSPVTGYTVTGVFGENRGDHVHSGLDMAVPSGTPIRAASCGTVASASYEGGYGNMVCINHSGGYSTCYAHMSRFAVGAGQYVRIGQVIGYVGCTGNCSGPHVHFEVRYHGTARDPQPYLKHQARIAGGTATSATRVAVYKTPTTSKAQTARAASVSDRGGFSTIAKGAAPQPAAQPAAQGQQPSSTTPVPAPAPASSDQNGPPADAPATDQQTADVPATNQQTADAQTTTQQTADAQTSDQQASDTAGADTSAATDAVDTT
ncbi:MAG TPA: peptidoglycan DD-metalloendopeptidase family protein, partial [Solirubrobacteraceae bacterium]|nr:peptidoglycan DD-metalloendopeptidase family protein [Solirubrobacteraceae bacterium]